MSTDLPLTPEDVADIVAILDGSAYQSLDVRTARFRLRVVRDGDGWTQSWDWNDEATGQTQVPSRDEAALAEEDTGGDGIAIRAPLPGTFYRAPQPGAPPFVEVGDAVGPDTVVGIIETMKLMNPVHAGAIGTIAAILVENGEMIGSAAVLMRVS